MRQLHPLFNLFTPPLFADNEELSRRASLLHTILFSLVMAAALYAVTFLIIFPVKIQIDAVPIYLILLFALFLHLPLHQGYVVQTSWLLVAGLWFIAIFAATVEGGIDSPGFVSILMVILIAGLLLDGQATMLWTVLSIVAGIGLVYAQTQNWLMPRVVPTAHLLGGYSVTFLTVGVLVRLAVGNMNRSLHRAQHELKERQTAENLLARIMDTVPDGLILLDKHFYIMATNPAAKTYLSVLGVTSLNEPLSQVGHKPMKLLLERPLHSSMAHEINLKEPAPRVFELIIHPINTETLNQGWVLMLRDVTEARQMQEQIQQQERLAAVGQLAAGIAHDFNNIMSVIVLYSQLLQQTATLSQQNQERVETIYRQAEHATRLIQQILDFSRRSVMARSDIDLLQLLQELMKLWQRTLPENIQLELLYDQAMYMVSADSTRLQQAIMNLAVNARDALPKGGILRLSLKRLSLTPQMVAPLPELHPGEWVVLSVIDNGVGISPQFLPRIFEPFFTTKKPGQGTGLGLAQVYGIVKQHDGHISIKSEPNSGTIFTLYLPLLKSLDAAPPPVTLPPISNNNQLKKVLIVENDAPVRQAVTEVLELMGYEIVTAENGRLALECFMTHNQNIDLIISDVVMPEMGGMELFLAVETVQPNVKMILMSGYPLDEGGKALLEKGVVTWMQKPFSLQALLQKVEEVLR